MMQLAQAIEAELQAHGLTTTLDELDTVLSLSVLSLVPSQPRWRFGGAGGASLASGLPGPGGKGTSEERDGMSKTGFYQCDYPTATACVFSEDNDLLPDGALECGPRRDDGPAVARAAHPLVGMSIRRRVRLTSSEMNTTTRQKRPLQTTRRTKVRPG